MQILLKSRVISFMYVTFLFACTNSGAILAVRDKTCEQRLREFSRLLRGTFLLKKKNNPASMRAYTRAQTKWRRLVDVCFKPQREYLLKFGNSQNPYF